MKMRPKNLSQAVFWDRSHLGMTLREYGRMVGASAPTLSRLENGYLPGLEVGLRLAHRLKLSVSDLIAETLDKINAEGGESVAKKKTKAKKRRKTTTPKPAAPPQPATPLPSV
jgi:transcriptional regulator with XRE-family HTH domain